jgi:hypothetical protein
MILKINCHLFASGTNVSLRDKQNKQGIAELEGSNPSVVACSW